MTVTSTERSDKRNVAKWESIECDGTSIYIRPTALVTDEDVPTDAIQLSFKQKNTQFSTILSVQEVEELSEGLKEVCEGIID